jgi:hypothetical protein
VKDLSVGEARDAFDVHLLRAALEAIVVNLMCDALRCQLVLDGIEHARRREATGPPPESQFSPLLGMSLSLPSTDVDGIRSTDFDSRPA